MGRAAVPGRWHRVLWSSSGTRAVSEPEACLGRGFGPARQQHWRRCRLASPWFGGICKGRIEGMHPVARSAPRPGSRSALALSAVWRYRGSPRQNPGRAEQHRQSPGASSPGASSPGASSPGASSPGASSPGASSPGASFPGASSPGASSPGASSPGASSPGASSPGASSPGASSRRWRSRRSSRRARAPASRARSGAVSRHAAWSTHGPRWCCDRCENSWSGWI
jgi:hypothetical protein